MRLQLMARTAALAVAVAPLAAACSEETPGRVSLALSTRPAHGATLAGAAGEGETSVLSPGAGRSRSSVITRDGDTLMISSAQLVLREIELERVEATDCPDTVVDEDACEEFETGPMLISLPLGGETAVAVTVNAPAAAYDELEFTFDDPDNTRDAAFIAANPDFRDASIRVSGTFSDNGVRSDFVFVSRLEEEHELELLPFLQVVDGESVTVTLRLDVASWFADHRGRLVNPVTANDDGPNEDLVEDNIERSIAAFRDDDRNGLADQNAGV